MRYHYDNFSRISMYGHIYECDHEIYSRCTLYLIGDKGLSVIQQRFDAKNKSTYWSNIDSNLTDALYLHKNFKAFFDERASEPINGVYPTVTLRQIMWALRMKPLKRERWETYFDRKSI